MGTEESDKAKMVPQFNKTKRIGFLIETYTCKLKEHNNKDQLTLTTTFQVSFKLEW